MSKTKINENLFNTITCLAVSVFGLCLVLLSSLEARAQTVNSQLTLSGASLTVSTSGTCNFSATVSDSSQNVSCTVSNLQVQDLRGSGVGWSSTLTVRNFDGGSAGILPLCPTIACASSRVQITPTTISSSNSTLGVTDYTTAQNATSLTNLTATGITSNFNLMAFSNATQTYRQANITNGGTGYTTAPTVVFTGGSCSQSSVATSALTSGVVTSITFSTAGLGCTSAPAISFTGGGGTGAAATAISGAGEGTFTKNTSVQITVPALTRAGTFTSIVTISAS